MTIPNDAVRLPVADGSVLTAHVARPAGVPAATGVIVAHELFGVTDDILGVTRDLASAGYLAVGPEFYHRDAPPGRWLGRDDAWARVLALPSGATPVMADSNLSARDPSTLISDNVIVFQGMGRKVAVIAEVQKGRPDSTRHLAWPAYVCNARVMHGCDVILFVSPSLASDLSGLPTAYIDAGSAEVFRDEDVAYATAIWAAGGQAELHIWAGGFHGFDLLAPAAQVSAAARAARNDWLTRLLGRGGRLDVPAVVITRPPQAARAPQA